MNELTGIVLAGGKSLRMGRDKSFISFNQKRLVEHSIEILNIFCDRIIISANSDDYDGFGFQVVRDNFPGCGPLAGLEAALAVSQTSKNLVIACDTPFVTAGIYQRLLAESDRYDAIFPKTGEKKFEPLVGCYSKEIYPQVRKHLQSGNYKLQNLLNSIHSKSVEFEESYVFDNINSPADMESKKRPDFGHFRNTVLISGAGRSVGKTYLACKTIENLSSTADVIALKFSPHHHISKKTTKIVVDNEKFTIVEETEVTGKDSSLLLQSGAYKSFYIESGEKFTGEAFQFIYNQYKNHPFVIESGGLAEFMQPGIFLFVKNESIPANKQKLLRHIPIIVKNDGHQMDFDYKKLAFGKGQFTLQGKMLARL